ncbi:MAG: hypothetical protein JXR11_11915 [Balneola sp.]
MFSTNQFYKEAKNQFSFLTKEQNFKLVTSKNENMFVYLEYEKEQTRVKINYDRRDNYLSISAINLRIPEEEFVHRFKNVEHFPKEIELSAKKVRSMCLHFLN